jgi:hypothetical protein
VSDSAKMFKSLDGRYNGQIDSNFQSYFAKYQGSWGVYEGEFRDGKSTNFGRFTVPTGESIVGYQFDKYPWEGVISDKNKNLYSGAGYLVA